MKHVDFLDALGRIDADLVDECFTEPQKQPKAKGSGRIISAIIPAAACFCVVLCVLIFAPRFIDKVTDPSDNPADTLTGTLTTDAEIPSEAAPAPTDTSTVEGNVVYNEGECIHGDYPDYHTFEGNFIDYVGNEAFDNWVNEVNALSAEENDPDCKYKYYNIVRFVRDFGITREKFDELYTNTFSWYNYVYDADAIYSTDEEAEAYFLDVDARVKEKYAREFEYNFKQNLAKYATGSAVSGDALRNEYSIVGLISDYGLSVEQYDAAYNEAFRNAQYAYDYKYAALVSGDLALDRFFISMTVPQLDDVMRGSMVKGGYDAQAGKKYNTDGSEYIDPMTETPPVEEIVGEDIAPEVTEAVIAPGQEINIPVEFDLNTLPLVDGVYFTEDMTQIVSHSEDFAAESYTVPDTVTKINNSAFAGAQSLKSVYIPDSVADIETGAFTNCYSLADVRLPSSLTQLKQSVFHNCTALREIKLPDTLKSIGFSAFANSGLVRAVLPEGLESIALNAFNNTALTTVTLPSTLTFLGDSAFGDCMSLEAIYVAAASTSFVSDGGILHSYDFETVYQCPIKTDITEYSLMGTKTIRPGAFRFVKGLKTIHLYDSLQTIGANAFYGSGLTSVDIPQSVTFVGDYAFYECYDLSSAQVYDTSFLGAFFGTPFYDTLHAEFELDEDGTTLVKYNGDGGDVYIPSGVQTIGRNAFSLIQNQKGITITYVYIPDTVTRIEANAFFACDGASDGLQTVRMSANIEYIGDSAFAENKYLHHVDFSEVGAQKITFGSDVFAYCGVLTEFSEPKDFNYTYDYSKSSDIFVGTPFQTYLTSRVVTVTDLSDESWNKLNFDGKISNECRQFFNDLLSGNSTIPEYNALKITDFTITRDDTLYSFYPSFYFDFTVTGKSLDALPPGEYRKVVLDIRDVMMYDNESYTGGDNDYGYSVMGEYQKVPEALKVTRYIQSEYCYDCYDYGEWPSYSGTVNYLLENYTEGFYQMKVDDFIALAERVFGIPSTTSRETIQGHIREDTGMIEPGGIGGTAVFKITDVKKLNNDGMDITSTRVGCITKVTVQLYADANALLPSHTLLYTIENKGSLTDANGEKNGWYEGENCAFVSCEVITESPYEPYGLHSIRDIG